MLPDPAEAVTRVWAEADSEEAATELLDSWTAVLERAGR